jgi:hypothetical protein
MGTKKNFITVVTCVIAAGEKLPLAFIASGKTVRVEESQIGPIDRDSRTHSKGGCQTSAYALGPIVFGLLKSHAKRVFHERFRLDPHRRRKKQEAVSDIMVARG